MGNEKHNTQAADVLSNLAGAAAWRRRQRAVPRKHVYGEDAVYQNVREDIENGNRREAACTSEREKPDRKEHDRLLTHGYEVYHLRLLKRIVDAIA